MKILHHFRLTWNNVVRNKDYALFCVAGTVLTIIFVTLILQTIYVFNGNYPPRIQGDRTIPLRSMRDNAGNYIYIPSKEINGFLENLGGYDHAALLHSEGITVASNKGLTPVTVGFSNGDLWKIYSFDFLEGKPFEEDDCINRKKMAVITEDASVSVFNTKKSIGNTLTFQDNEYEICGVIKRFPLLAGPSTDNCGIYVPYTFNKFIPSGNDVYSIQILYPSDVSIIQAKEKVHRAIVQYFEQKEKKIDIGLQNIKTTNETVISFFGGSGGLFAYGAIAIFLLLLIPAINILSLNIASSNNRVEEIAVRRTFGASRAASFLMIMSENLMLTTIGTCIGVVFTVPAFNLIQQNLLNIVVVSRIDYWVIFTGVIPVMLLFTLMSGGLPAYFISKRNIAQVLKGGSK